MTATERGEKTASRAGSVGRVPVPDMAERQPDGKLFSSNPVTRYLFDWYYMRIFTYVTSRRVRWWDGGDMTSEPHEVTL